MPKLFAIKILLGPESFVAGIRLYEHGFTEGDVRAGIE
jgi:hypothetical protein